VFHRKRMDWYSDCKRIYEQEVEKWNYRSINRVLAKYRHTGTTDRKKGSGRPVSAMTDENLAEVEQLCQSQDGKPGTHESQRQAARIIGVSRSSL